MTVNPLLIVAALFAVSFSGRAVSVAYGALSKEDKTELHEPLTATAGPMDLTGMNSETSKEQHTEHSGLESTDTHNTNGGAHPVLQASHKMGAMEQRVANAKLSGTAANRTRQYDDLLTAIRDRARALDTKAAAIEDRMRVLEVMEKRVAENLAELQTNNEELSKLVNYANEASQKDIDLLARMYEQMKPAKAGEIFDKMNPTFAAGFLTEMNSESAALILTNMSTEQAYKTSMIIASRNAAVHSQ